uniref:Uncharacterized protein n=1 Tax=Saimiri boliviensis boliviensis TaxID=39432 RepID=A0A2K6UJJ7_SAIBB
QHCARESRARPCWDCMARCFLQAPGLPSSQHGEASGGTGTVSLTLSQPRERDQQEGALGVGAALWQSQRFLRQTDRVLMHSESQSVFTGVSAGDKQFTTTSSIVFTI